MGALSFGALCFSSLLTIIDPLAAAPLFVGMTGDADARSRRRMALRACAVAFGLLVLFAAGGRLIFGAFGITIEAFRIAGGILFFAMAMPMLLGAGRHAREQADVHAGADPSIVPLGMPIICGPGAISTVMVLMGQSVTALHVLALFVAIVLVVAVTAGSLLVAPAMLRVVGRSGLQVVTQVMGLIICVIGIQFVIDGVRPLVVEILASVR